MSADAPRVCALIKRRGVVVSRSFAERVLDGGGGGSGAIEGKASAVLQAWFEEDIAKTDPVPQLPGSTPRSTPTDGTPPVATTLERAVVLQIDAALDVSRAACVVPIPFHSSLTSIRCPSLQCTHL
jgi:hypothetical protein